MLEVVALRSGYGANDILEGVNLRVVQGAITALIGSNGAGKTTLLRSISGLLRPRAGEIRLQGTDVMGLSPAQIVQLGVVQVPEGRELFARMSVHENLLLGAHLQNASSVRRNLDRVFTYFPVLRTKASQNARDLSGGEQQMVAFGRALMAQPKYLLLDEPSVGLAPVVEKRLIDTVQGLAKFEGIGVLLVEQNATLALSVSEDAYVLELGNVSISGPASRLAKDPAIRKAYLGL